MAKGTKSGKVKVPTTGELVRTLSRTVKKHLLDNGIEPAVMNEEVIRAALREFNATQKT
jgi:hypothetical protein